MRIIDSHCHLEMCGDVTETLRESEKYHLSGANTIGTRWSARKTQKDLVAQGRNFNVSVWASLGTHPTHVTEEMLPTLEEMVADLQMPGIIGVGETGLDYFRCGEETKEKQIQSFRRHIEAGRETGLPVIIHCRNAAEDVLKVLEEESKRGVFSFLIHCFAENLEFAKKIASLGGFVSFSGLLTFPKCNAIREAAGFFPLERILLETDSPFLAPVPKRGKQNIPGWTYFVAQRLGQLRNLSEEEIAEQTTENFFHLFSKAALE